MIPTRKLKNFYPGVAEHKDISKLVLLLSSSVNSLRKAVHEALQDFQKYKTLWTEDRDVKVKVCFHYWQRSSGCNCFTLVGRPGKCQRWWWELRNGDQEPVNATHLAHLVLCNSDIDTGAIDNNEAQADFVQFIWVPSICETYPEARYSGVCQRYRGLAVYLVGNFRTINNQPEMWNPLT